MRSWIGGLLAAVVLFASFANSSAAQDGGIYNHKAPEAYPQWFVPVSELGVTQWLNTEEVAGFNTTAPAHFNYVAKTKLTSKALVKLVESYAHAHDFQVINLLDPERKIVIAEVDLDKDPVAGTQRMMKLHHNHTISIDAGEGEFTLTISENPM